MDAEIGIIADQLPIEPAVLVEGEFAAAAFMAGVGGAGGVTLGDWTAQGAGMASQESAATIATKSPVPVRYGERDEDFDAIARGRMCDRGVNATPTVGGIERRGIDGGVGDRNLCQILARAHGLDIGIKGFGRSVSGPPNSDRGNEDRDEDQ